MRRLTLAGLLASACLLVLAPHPARAQSVVVVTTCPTTAYLAAGINRPLVEDVNGHLCTGGGGVVSLPTTVATTDRSGSVTTGGVAQAAIALNTARKGWCITNPSTATLQGIGTAESLFVRVNGTASAATGTEVTAGSTVCGIIGTVDTAAVSVFAATTAHKWLGSEVQ